MRNWLIIYDIQDNKRLSKVAKVMKDYGIRVQNSVFEAIAEYKDIQCLREKIKTILKDDDSVVYFDICNKDWNKQKKFGCGDNTIYKYKNFEIY